MKHILAILVISTFTALPFGMLLGKEAETNIKQPLQISGMATAADTDDHNISPFYGKSWAVVIGINRYERWPGLEYAVNDATSVKNHLKKLGFDEIISLMDHEATKHNITQLLGDTLLRQVHKDDRVLIFFAGHGQTEDIGERQYGYIIPVDGDTQNYYSSAISMSQVREFSRRIPAKHIYYVIDACYSGLGLIRSGPRFSPSMEGYLKKVTALPAVQMVTAGGKGEQVLEVEGHGLFTEYFLKGIEGQADADDDGVVTASELGAYLRPSVSKASEQKQTPLFGSMDGEGEFIFILPDKGNKTAAKVEPEEQKRQQERLLAREKVLHTWEEMLKREEKELQKQVEMKDTLKHQEQKTRKKEEGLKIQEENAGTNNQYTEDEKGIGTEPPSAHPDIIEITKLRSRSATLSKGAIREMIKNRGFRDSEWNPDGDFPNKYEKVTTGGGAIVIDHATALMWQQSGSSGELSFSDADNYIYQLNGKSYAGFSDWRLPTVEELASLLEPGKNEECYIDPVFDPKQQWFWSADKRPSGKAWSVSIRAGIVTLESDDSKYYVRGIRSR